MDREDILLGIIVAESIWLGLFLWHPPRCLQDKIYIQVKEPIIQQI